MTANRRIFLNIIATYGRSLYALVIGLFCGRWTLMVLGEVDYGLVGVVGGLTAFVTFLNVIMSSGVGRFYAISVGRTQVDESQGLDECHQWFTTAVVVHTIFPTVLMMIGYPIGEWAVRGFLTIPLDRVESCIWVWRCVCISAFVGMISVPFTAWYGAKQEIAELTVYGFVTTTLNVVFLYYALQHPGDWLAPIAVWNLALFIVPKLIICCRAGRKYRECKFEWRFVLTSWERIRQMLGYSGWLLIGSAADMLKEQGVNVLVNKCFGPRLNAAKAVGGSLSQHCLTLTSSLIGAFWPAIIGAYGAGEMEKVKRYVYRVCRLATILVLIFAIPLALEVDEVLVLWLKTPPKAAAGVCVFCMLYMVIDMTSCGYFIAAHATGKIREYQIGVGGTALLTLPCALLVVVLGGGIYWVMASIVALRLCVACVRVFLAQRLMPLGMRFWVLEICAPMAAIALVTIGIGVVPRLLMAASFSRVVITTAITELTILPLTWKFLLGEEEKSFVLQKLHAVLPFNMRRR